VAMASRGKLLTAIDLLGCLIGKFRRPTVDACSILQRWWAKTDAAVVGGSASEDQVRALEQRYNVSLPEDFRAYLRTACPAAECWDAEGTAWWSLDRIKNIPDEYAHQIKNPDIAPHSSQYLFFADYLVWCWAWAISCTNDDNRGKVMVIDGRDDPFVANSFSEFVECYIADWSSVSPRAPS